MVVSIRQAISLRIFWIYRVIPYYKKAGKFSKYDVVTEHNLSKYFALSKDNPDKFYHTPDKTLIVVLKLKDSNRTFIDSKDYADYYRSIINDNDLLEYSTKVVDKFSDGVILNDYSDFLQRTYYITEGKLKK